MNAIGLILLAAGGSRRLGRPKQLLKINEKTLLRRACETALESGCQPIVAVLTPEHESAMRDELQSLPITVTINHDWQSGMASSIRCGIEQIQRESQLDAVVIMLADQPAVDASMIQQLIKAARKNAKPLAAAAYNDTVGVPALFSSEFFDAICNLQGDRGAKQLLINHAHQLVTVPMPQAKLDIDTEADLGSHLEK